MRENGSFVQEKAIQCNEIFFLLRISQWVSTCETDNLHRSKCRLCEPEVDSSIVNMKYAKQSTKLLSLSPWYGVWTTKKNDDSRFVLRSLFWNLYLARVFMMTANPLWTHESIPYMSGEQEKTTWWSKDNQARQLNLDHIHSKKALGGQHLVFDKRNHSCSYQRTKGFRFQLLDVAVVYNLIFGKRELLSETLTMRVTNQYRIQPRNRAWAHLPARMWSLWALICTESVSTQRYFAS